jgi:hypothetical protein
VVIIYKPSHCRQHIAELQDLVMDYEPTMSVPYFIQDKTKACKF